MRLACAPAGALAPKEFAMAVETAGMGRRYARFLPPRAFVWSLALHLLALTWVTGPHGAAVRARLPLPATLRLQPAPATVPAPATAPAEAKLQSLAASRTSFGRAPRRAAPPEPNNPSHETAKVLAATPPPSSGSAPTAPAVRSVAPAAAAPEPERVEGDELALENYGRRLADAIAHRRRYPRLAALRGWQGEVHVRVQVARKGAIVAVQLLRSSGYGVLDADAVQLVQEAEALPSPPSILEDREFQVVVPILYKLDRPAA